ncbi:tryptophan synthase beta subunit-like PLP-dependent enzyme [Nemania sp. FL0916]|nr:tryptophan synthase beta subunit-like PLP-dependent enzyme [Nemania sp. FL0916]
MADPATSPPLTRNSVLSARNIIKDFVHHTPTLTNATLDRLASTPQSEGKARPRIRLYFKCENLQRIGAFKIRGAFHAIERLKKEPGWVEGGGRERGVVTHSSGNHAQALALAARENGIPAHIVMPTISAAPKIAATRGYGAQVVFSGSTSDEREAMVAEVVQNTGARLVPPYDHPDIVLGQGTLGLELQEDAGAIMRQRLDHHDATAKASTATITTETGFRAPATIPVLPERKRESPRLDAILAPCGGGGMLSGVALSCEGTGIRVFGCEPSFQGADDGKRGYESGERVTKVKTLTVADGLRTPVGVVPWGIIYERRLVKGFFSVTEEEIVGALKLVYERFKMVVEPSAAVPLAVALYNEDFRRLVELEGGEEGWDVGVVFSGGNVSLEALGKLFGGEGGK